LYVSTHDNIILEYSK